MPRSTPYEMGAAWGGHDEEVSHTIKVVNLNSMWCSDGCPIHPHRPHRSLSRPPPAESHKDAQGRASLLSCLTCAVGPLSTGRNSPRTICFLSKGTHRSFQKKLHPPIHKVWHWIFFKSYVGFQGQIRLEKYINFNLIFIQRHQVVQTSNCPFIFYINCPFIF